MTSHPPASTGGLPYALGAYLLWGLLPLYIWLLDDIAPFEFVGWRVILTLPVCLVLVMATGKTMQLRAAIGNPKALGILVGSAFVIAANWLIYVIAVQSGHIFAASLGYYINPLVNVLAGTLFFRERLTRWQWAAVAIAGAGVAILAWGALDMLWISLSLAASFATYGILRKIAPVESLPGLTIESLILLLPAAGLVAWQAHETGVMAFGNDPGRDLLLSGAGAITAAPLLLFAAAARRMEYSALGFVQFLAPTIAFLLGLTVFGEDLEPVQLVCFLFIWTAIAVFSADLLSRRRKSSIA